MSSAIVDIVESQIIAAIKHAKNIKTAVQSSANVAFLLTGDLLHTGEHVSLLKEAGMRVFIHLDLIAGLATDKSAVKFVAQEWQPDGVITTRTHVIKWAKDEGLMTIQRLFLIDQSALSKGVEMVQASQPDAIEVLPGIIPRIIYELSEQIPKPIIVGGLIRHKEEIMDALRAGALAVSSGNPTLWQIKL